MPGLFAFIRKRKVSKEENEGLLESLKGVLHHRNYYEANTYVDGNAGLGLIHVGFRSEEELLSCREERELMFLDGWIYRVDGRGEGTIGANCNVASTIMEGAHE